MTHRAYDADQKFTSDLLWETTAQCGPYAYLKSYGEEEALEAFERLSPRQPFIYRTWEGLRVNSKQEVIDIVKNLFHENIPKAPPKSGTYDDFSEFDE